MARCSCLRVLATFQSPVFEIVSALSCGAIRQFVMDIKTKWRLNHSNMPKTLKLKFVGDGSVFNSHRAWIVLGIKSTDNDGDLLLSAGCATASEVEKAAEHLRKKLDEIVISAKRKFPSSASSQSLIHTHKKQK